MAQPAVATIAPLAHPILQSIKQAKIVEFANAYEKYVSHIDELNASRSETRKAVPASRKACIDVELLRSLVQMQVFGTEVMNLRDVTEEHVMDFLKKRTAGNKASLGQRVERALALVSMVPDEADPEGTALQFFANIHKELRRHGAECCIQDSGKEVIRQVMEKLQPECVRQRITREYPFWSSEKREDFRAFQKAVIDVAVVTAPDWPKHNDKKRPGGRSEVPALKKGKLDPSAAGTRASGSRFPGCSEAQWTKKCLNPDCKEKHPVRSCPITPKEKADELLRTLKEKKGSGGHKAAHAAKRTGAQGTFAVEICGLPAQAIPDTGSDHTIIGLDLLDRIHIDGEQYVPKVMLSEPERFLTAKTSAYLTAVATCFIDVKLDLICGPLMLRKVSAYVVSDHMEEVILGRDLLLKLGFDPESALERLAATTPVVDCSVESADGKSADDFPYPDSARKHGEPERSSSEVTEARLSRIVYRRTSDDSVELPADLAEQFGEDSRDEIRRAMEFLVTQAKEQGLSEAGCGAMRRILMEYENVFSIRLGRHGPAKVDPYSIRLKEMAKPVKCTQRRYAEPQRNFLQETIRKLEAIGAVVKTARSRWASPALAVPKPGAEGFRFTVDCRAVNRQTVAVTSAMPHVGAMLQRVEGSNCYASMDLVQAYWQIPLAEETREILSIQTPCGVYSPTRLLQGSTDAGNHFQAVTSDAFAPLEDNLLQYMDDFLLHASSETGLLDALRKFLEICCRLSIRVSVKKSKLFLKRAQFCGRILDDKGVIFNPRHFESLRNMSRPGYGAELQQFLCAVSWMRMAIPEYARKVAPLLSLLESTYRKAGKRTRAAVAKVPLDWQSKHDDAFAAVKYAIENQVRLGHPRATCVPCLFTDASDCSWAGVLTQVPQSDVGKPVMEQAHEPLAFLSGAFRGTQERWSTVEKEGFAVVESMERTDFLHMGREVYLFTDHANLVQLFDPTGSYPGVAKHTASKMTRWALRLCAFRYVIEHIPGVQNVWADILTRWARAPNQAVQASRIRRIMYAPVAGPITDRLQWPSHKDLKAAQKSATTAPAGLEEREGLLRQGDKGLGSG